MTAISGSNSQTQGAEVVVAPIETPLFQNYHGIRGRLPEELVQKLIQKCKEHGLKDARDEDSRESWFDIFSKVDGKRTYVMVQDAKDGPIKVSGALTHDVMAALKEITLEQGAQGQGAGVVGETIKTPVVHKDHVVKGHVPQELVQSLIQKLMKALKLISDETPTQTATGSSSSEMKSIEKS